MTLFDAAGASPEHELISIFGTVEEHHGEHSHDPPLDEIEVLGAEPTPEVWTALSAFGFTEVVPARRGFVATYGR